MLSRQRDGRIVRQGNENPEVEIYKYVTKNTFDAYSWQLIEAKQKFIGQIFTSKSPVRSAEDVDDIALSYGEVKACATGDDRLKIKMELDIAVTKLSNQESSHRAEQYDMQEKLGKTIPMAIKTAKTRISNLEIDQSTARKNPVTADFFKIELGGVTHTERKSAGEALQSLCKQMEKPKEPMEIGEYRGFPVELTFTGSQFKVELKGEVSHAVVIESDPVGNMKRIDNCLEGISKEIDLQTGFVEQKEKEIVMLQGEVGKPFPHEAELQSKIKELKALDKELASIKTPKREKKKPSVLGKLKELKQEGEQKKGDSPKNKGKSDQTI
ncbi:MAG: hypothetical protein R3Y63_15625 [Eubacteriales bacterium]